MIVRLILPEWAQKEYLDRQKVLEGDFADSELKAYNDLFYNIYYLPNSPEKLSAKSLDGTDIVNFNYVFVDMDLKDEVYTDKDHFIAHALQSAPEPSRIVDSGNGIHMYWKVSDLDAMGFLRLNRRLYRLLTTDEAVSKIFQLMRLPGYDNHKRKDDPTPCALLYETEKVYTCEELDKILPDIKPEDEDYCTSHFNKTYKLNTTNLVVNDTLPDKFAHLLRGNKEVKTIWAGGLDDRSKGDWRLGHIMFASGFTKEEGLSVLVNSGKALSRAPEHRIQYGLSIIEKVWGQVEESLDTTDKLSYTAHEILQRSATDTSTGIPFRCHSYIDATEHGFRLGQVIGLVAGSGVGKTAMALNMFEGFVQTNPDYEHFFIPLEQPAKEIAERWRELCGDNTTMHSKVHIISNYKANGEFRHLSLAEIKDYILKFQKDTSKKVGCIVIDHIGALKKKGLKGENQDLMDICHEMKAFAVQTNTLLVMQSQAPREKAGIGDLELNKDAAYGTVFFESYCDYLIAIWQPLKRCYSEAACPTVTAFKFCKIRHKRNNIDEIKEDVAYRLFFDPASGKMREMTQDEERSFDFFNKVAINKRKQDRKTDILSYKSITWTKQSA